MSMLREVPRNQPVQQVYLLQARFFLNAAVGGDWRVKNIDSTLRECGRNIAAYT